ncbi:MAG: PKD domain-containing protein, partial [Archaeoglobaceae archaeon]
MRFAALALLLLIFQASALQLSVSGGCVGEPVEVYTDRDAIVVFRLNGGTPIFGKANSSSAAVFTPQVEGKLSVAAISGEERAEKTVEVRMCASGVGSAKNYLPSGTFVKVVDGKEYEISWRTALGALEFASRIKGFDYKLKETEWGLFVDCIREVCTNYAGKGSGWMYWVNYPDEPMPGVAATEYRVKGGDEVVWFFARSMSDTPDTSIFVIRILVEKDYSVYVSVKWASNTPPVAVFSFSPPQPAVGEEITFDASGSFDPDGFITDYRWSFGDGSSASGKVVKHAYSEAGNYTVTLEVVDNNGASNRMEKVVRVRERVAVNESELVVVNVSEVRMDIPLKKIVVEEPVKLKIRKVSPPGILYADVYACFEVTANRSVGAELYFEVPAEWGDVSFYRYEGRWEKLRAELVGENGNLTYVVRVENLSVFAVAKDWKDFPLSCDEKRVARAYEYLRGLQRDSGGFANPGEEESVAKTAWAVMAISICHDPHTWKRNGKSPLDYIRERIVEELPKMGTADYARTILALVAAGEDPRSFAGVDLVSKLKERVREDGRIGDYVYTTIWGIIALSAVGENVSRSVEWLKAQQNEDGGFPWSVGVDSDYDDTAAAIQALIAAGEPKDSEVIKRAVEYLRSGQNEDGGMRYFGNSASNAASDAWTIQALVAAGINPRSWVKNNVSVVDHLLSLQEEDGHFRYTKYQTDNPGYMTACAIMALLGKPHPIKPERIEATTVTPIATT